MEVEGERGMVGSREKVAVGRRCMVLYRESLLAQGIAVLLKADPEVDVVMVDMEREDALKAFRALNPGVVIVDVNDLPGIGDFLAELLKGSNQVKVMCLDPTANAIHILKPQTKAMRSSREFFASLWEEV
jgi:DNA-binding NarL/FixJ family response regulator